MGVEQVLSTENQSTTNYDYSKLFLTGFKTIPGNIAASGADIELEVGMLVGRISATGKLAICKSASNDGSQIPLGICMVEKTVSDGSNLDIVIAVTGRIDETKLVLDGTDTLDTAFDGRILRDRIPADTEGIELDTINGLVELDNQ